jgi:two-component system, NtrC family, response regulator HupR/HoxA
MTLNGTHDVIVIGNDLPWEAPGHKTLKQQVEELERKRIADALARCRWNKCKTAAFLGLSRVGLANKIRRYGLDGGESG